MSEVPKLQRFNKKTGPPKWQISFYIVSRKLVFQAHRRVPRTTGVVELCKKNILQWKPMELGGVPQKNDEYVHLGPKFYVCSSARNWVSFMYKGIYHIRNSLLAHRRPVSYTHFFNAKRVFACILFCSWPCFSFSFDACAFVGTMIALNLAIVIQNLPRTQKIFNLLGFTHVFDMGISLFLWHLLWHCLCAPKFYPKYFYSKYSKFVFFCPHP